MTSLDFEIDQSEIRTKTPATLSCTRPSHNAMHSISVLLIICQQIWPAQSIHKVFLQIFPKVTLFPWNCLLPSIPEMPRKQNKRTYDSAFMSNGESWEESEGEWPWRHAVWTESGGVPLQKKSWDHGRCRACCRWNGTILDYCSCVPFDLFADWRFVPNLRRNWTVHFSVWGIRSEGSIRIKACFDLRSLQVQEILNVISTNAVQWQEERSVWSQPKNGCI